MMARMRAAQVQYKHTLKGLTYRFIGVSVLSRRFVRVREDCSC